MSKLAVAVWTRELAGREKSLREAADNLGMKNTRNEDMGKVVEFLRQQADDYLAAEMELAEAEHNATRRATEKQPKIAVIKAVTKPGAKKPTKKKSWGLSKLGNQNLRLIVFKGGPFDKQPYYGTSPQAGTTVPFKFSGYRGRYVDGHWEENTATPHL